MERLTSRDEYGNADIVGVDSEDLQINIEFSEFNKVTDALNRLAAYEDTNLTPSEITDLTAEVAALRQELAVLKEAGRCEWTQTDDDSGLWQCDKCQTEWTMEVGTPIDNQMTFCPQCGRIITAIKVLEWNDEEGEWEHRRIELPSAPKEV